MVGTRKSFVWPYLWLSCIAVLWRFRIGKKLMIPLGGLLGAVILELDLFKKHKLLPIFWGG